MSQERYLLGACELCGQHIEFPAEGAGLKVACPHCAGETVLAESGSQVAAAAAGEEITAAELKEGLSGILPRRRISVFYQVGLGVVAFFMVLLPPAYLSFATAAAYGTYWYARHASVLFSSLAGGAHVMIFKLLIYAGPVLGGAVAVFFMFKPFLARSPKRAEPIELNPAEHPRLYQLIAHLSDLLRVAMPKRVFLDCELNASAAFRRGYLSFFGSDLVLTLGLPLVAGLDVRQLAAVVSHELGHCTQATAMRLSYVINRIDGWFVRVVYQRDTWDEALEEWSNSVEDWRMSLLVACIGFAVWLSRRVLALLMMLGHASSCFLSRQMEYHADACAMAVAGSEGLESLLLRLRELAVIEQLGWNGLSQAWKKRHLLPDSVPDYFERLEGRLAAGFHEQARLTLLNETAGLFDTHPTPCKRIQKARRRCEPGLFHLAKPARDLFRDFGSVARKVTTRHYRQTLHLAVTDPMLKPVDEFFQQK